MKGQTRRKVKVFNPTLLLQINRKFEFFSENFGILCKFGPKFNRFGNLGLGLVEEVKFEQKANNMDDS